MRAGRFYLRSADADGYVGRQVVRDRRVDLFGSPVHRIVPDHWRRAWFWTWEAEQVVNAHLWQRFERWLETGQFGSSA